MIYPGSSPEFRILERKDGTKELQVRYVNETQGYKGKWESIPLVKQDDTSNSPNI